MKLSVLRLALIVIVALTALCLACGPGGEWVEWQNRVLERQRENDIETPTPAPELDNLRGHSQDQGVRVAWGG
jgi:hypothetical protein